MIVCYCVLNTLNPDACRHCPNSRDNEIWNLNTIHQTKYTGEFRCLTSLNLYKNKLSLNDILNNDNEG